jgi:hypothetical protein
MISQQNPARQFGFFWHDPACRSRSETGQTCLKNRQTTPLQSRRNKNIMQTQK